MSKVIDMTGWIMSEHGVPESRLTVIRRVENDNYGHIQWLCECSCENHSKVIIRGDNIRDGHIKSCGCLNIEKATTVHNKTNIYDLSGQYGVGWTSNTNKEFYFDLEDYDKIKDFCWHENIVGGGFHCLRAYNPQTQKHIRMHVLLGFKGYDHIDRNELNNLKSNLRKCTHQENIRNSSLQKNNTSGFVGVSWDKKREKWFAHITINGKSKYLGSSSDKDSVIRMRLYAELRFFGEFAPQRHLFEQYGITNTEQND